MLVGCVMVLLFGAAYSQGSTVAYFFSAVAVFFFAIYFTYRFCLSFADS